ncbi:MAG: ribonuclease Z [Prevotella sp.]|nr:ribonuclease Z [Prevotella sp.]
METFRVHVLGCGSARPSLRHNASAQVVEMRGKMLMVDCAEGTQMQLMRAKINFNKIKAVFISHLHGDHCFGLLGLISSFGLLGRTAPLLVAAPKQLEPIFHQAMPLFCANLGYDVEFMPLDTKKAAVVYDDRTLSVTTIPLMHRVPCCGFLFQEKPTLPHIRRDMIDCYGIPTSQINNIKMGADWVADDGTVVPNGQLVTPADPPRSFAYCSDTKYIPTLHQCFPNVSLLYHESTYDQSYEALAEKYFHSTAAQAAMVARDAGASQLMIGHYSSRFNDEQVLLDEAKAIFHNTILAQEGLVVDVR